MSSVKLHVFRGSDNGTESCDYRGDKFIGAPQGDSHRTVAEIDPADEDLIKEVLETGPTTNRLFARIAELQPGFGGNLATLLGLEGSGPVGVRVGVWDE